MPARPFKPKPRSLWLPLLALAAIIGMALFLFLPPSKSFDSGHSVVPVTAADALGIKDWKPISGEIDSGDKHLEFTYGRGGFNQDQVIGLKGKFAIDGKYAPWVGKGFYRVQIPLFNRLQHAAIAIDDTKNANVTTSSDAPQPMPNYRRNIPNPQNVAEAAQSSYWGVATGDIYLTGVSPVNFPVTPIVPGGPTQCGSSMPVRALMQQRGFTYYWVQCPAEENGRKDNSNRIEHQAIFDGRFLANYNARNVFNNTSLSVARDLMN